jgi:hypothetical protein
MRSTLRSTLLSAALLALAAAPAAAQHLALASAGFRAGLSDEPEQASAGLVFDLGELAPRLRLQPSLDVASGKNGFSAVGLLAPVHYRFPPLGALHPYAGGGVQFSYIETARPTFQRRPRSHDYDVAPVAVGGFDLPFGRRGGGLQRLSLELEVGGGDAYDARLVFGVMF